MLKDIIEIIRACIADAKALKAENARLAEELAACKAGSAGNAEEIAELKATVAELKEILSQFQPSGNQ